MSRVIAKSYLIRTIRRARCQMVELAPLQLSILTFGPTNDLCAHTREYPINTRSRPSTSPGSHIWPANRSRPDVGGRLLKVALKSGGDLGATSERVANESARSRGATFEGVFRLSPRCRFLSLFCAILIIFLKEFVEFVEED